MANVTKPLQFCGKGAMEIAGDVVEHWAIGTVGDAGTAMLTTYVSDRFDGKSPQEAFQSVMGSADDILINNGIPHILVQMESSHELIFLRVNGY